VDIATVIGIILGSITIVGAIVLGGSILIFINVPSILVVGVGSVAAALVAYPLSGLLGLPKIMMKAFFAKPQPIDELITQLVSFAEVARRDGILSLENHMEEMKDPFIVQGVQMAVDGTDPELIEQIMDSDLENLVARHNNGRGVLEAVGKYAPAFGMIGTLIGLVAMLANMDDPSSIGGGMAVALLTTLYGAVISNLFALPMADKLKLRSDEEVLAKTVIIRGVMSIQSGDNPRVVEQKLRTFLPPGLRAAGDDEDEGGMKAAA